MRYRRALLLLSVVFAAVPSHGGAATLATESTDRACGKPTRVHAFHVEAKWSKRVYRRSEKAVVVVTVTRPAHEDPFELGITLPVEPPISVPADGVTVTTAILTDDFWPPYGYGVTNADGQVKFKISIRELEPGKYDATHLASKWTNEGGCPDIEEWGFTFESPAVTVTP